MPDRWTITRVVGRVYRDVLEPLGFQRRGNVCTRTDVLSREIHFSTSRWGDPSTRGIDVLLLVKINGLPEPVAEFRRDGLWAHLRSADKGGSYARPQADAPPPADLMSDIAGPGIEFLCGAADLLSMAQWATEVHDSRPTWGRFTPVYPQGSAPLHIAAYVGTILGDDRLRDAAIARVMAEERDRDERERFRLELDNIAGTDG